MEPSGRRLLYQQFQDAFPIESLKEMPLEKYTNLNKKDSFCYWMESKTYNLGSIWGGTSFKFGIYMYLKPPAESVFQFQTDDKYAWYAKYNKDTAIEAYHHVRDAVVAIANHARKGELEAIDKIDTFGDVFKWKIAFMYSNESLIPIYKRDMLEIVSEELGMKDAKSKSIPHIQRFLMLKKGDVDIYEYYEKLLEILDNENKKNTFSSVKNALKEKLKSDESFHICKTGKSYLWIGKKDGTLNTSECHYEFCCDGTKKASHNKNKVFVELHCETKKAEKYKSLADIEGVQEFPWDYLGIRANNDGWQITDFTTEDLADLLIEELYKLDELIGDKAKAIYTQQQTQQTKTNIKYWLYAPGENAFKWDWCQQNNMMCIGWHEIQDLSVFNSLEEVRSNMKKVYNNPQTSFKNDGLAVWEFVRVMKPGDIVFAKKGKSKIIGRGIVTGNYIYDSSLGEYCNVRAVKWTNVGEWEAPHDSALKTLTDITKYPDYVKELENLFAPEQSKQHWMLVANPKIWRLSDMKVGEEQSYTLYNDNGYQRRIFKNFLNAKTGDFVIGYEATPQKQIVAVLEISKENDGKNIWFKKKESLATPISYATIKGMPELKEMEFFVNSNGSLFKLNEDEYNVIMDLIRDENPISQLTSIDKYTDEDFLKDVFVQKEELETLKSLLLRKKNLILQGAPGVGKTFSAKRLSYSIMGMKDDQRIELIQFHQSYTYEDFIMGYKPNDEGGFYLKKGVFYTFCKKAKADPNRPYFFIIDEINRGNLSKIFGELLMLIESDYRNAPIKLAYTDELFDVPDNVHIIGMMNTADRSLAMIDYALRRRFSFFDMHPGFDSEGFKKYQAKINDPLFDKAVETVVALNKVIANDASLGIGFCIGHSYFCNCKEFSHDWLENVICYDLLPMLREYWFDNDEQYNSQSNALLSILK